MEFKYQEILDEIKNDKRSGAWVVAQKAINCIETLISEKAGTGFSELIVEIENAAAIILKTQPGMAQLINFFNLVFVTIENEASENPIVLSRKVSGEVRRFHELANNAVAQVAKLGAKLITDDSLVLVHSNSSTLLKILKKAHEDGKLFHVLISESRPINEGQACAEELAKLQIESTYFVDAALSKAVDRADVILLGADSVSEISVVNKIGTRAIALLAKEAVVEAYIACESSKFLSRKLAAKKETPRNPNEVWENPPAEVTIENYYFDDTPLEILTGVITEDGILTPNEIGGKIDAQKLSTKLLKLLK